MKKIFILTLITLNALLVFGGLGKTYWEIISGLEDYLIFEHRKLQDGRDCYNANLYDVIDFEIVGDKNNPDQATIMMGVLNDPDITKVTSMLFAKWLENITTVHANSIINWVGDKISESINKNASKHEKYFSGFLVNIIQLKNLIVVSVTRHELTSAKSRLTHLIKITTEPKASGYIQINESEPKETINEHVESGANTTLTAIPEEGNVFDGWFKGGVFVTDENPYTTEFTSLTILEARFRRAGTINIVSDEFKLDENIQIKINGNDLPTITSFVLYITYDMDILEPAKKSLFSLSETLTDYDFYNATVMDDGKIKISIGTTKTNPALIDGIIGIMEFRSKGTKGETNITITDDSKILGVDFREMELVFEHGIVFIDD